MDLDYVAKGMFANVGVLKCRCTQMSLCSNVSQTKKTKNPFKLGLLYN